MVIGYGLLVIEGYGLMVIEVGDRWFMVEVRKKYRDAIHRVPTKWGNLQIYQLITVSPPVW